MFANLNMGAVVRQMQSLLISKEAYPPDLLGFAAKRAALATGAEVVAVDSPARIAE